MQTTFLFRFLLITSVALAIAGIIVGTLATETLAPELRDYLIAQDEKLTQQETIPQKILYITFTLIFIISIFLSWKLRYAGRFLYTATTIVGFIAIRHLGITISTPWETTLNGISTMMSGAVILMMFTGDIGNKFNKISHKPSKA